MTSEKTIIEALYNNFLLRDLFAKIAPGSMVLASVLHDNPLAEGVVTLTDLIGWGALLVFAGVAWIVGFAVQEIGEFSVRGTKFICHHPERYEDNNDRYNRRIAFSDVASESEVQQVERYAVIKEATGNSATAIVAIIGILGVRYLPSYFCCDYYFDASAVISGLLLIALAIVFALALFKANRDHAHKQYDFIDSVLDKCEQKKLF